jgi:PIN domain nuclease of toxin-antitoxin system
LSKTYLLDTHIILAILRSDVYERFPWLARLVAASDFLGVVSVASLWEIAIKTRLGKLDPGVPVERMQFNLQQAGLTILPIKVEHVLTAAHPEPPTRDPFDRLLLAQAQVEGLQLVTIDRALIDHPLAYRF